MDNLLSLRALKAHTLRNKFNIIIGLIIIILLVTMLNVLASIKVMSGIRAYVGGEGLWSKAQKEAVTSLLTYTASRQESDYDKYLEFINVPMGDKQARLELDKPSPDDMVVRQGFIQGENNPADVDDLIFLYRNFRHVSYMSSAISVWTRGDEGIQSLLQTGDQIHLLVSSTAPGAAINSTQLATLRGDVHRIDNQLTSLENEFSATLGTGSRNISRFLLELTLFTTGILGALSLIIALLVGRAVIRLDAQKSEFVSMASHQLRTPLTAINWYTESLAEKATGPLNDRQKEYVKELTEGGQRMANLISDLLRVSSLDLGTYKPDIQSVDIGATLQAVLQDLHAQISKKSLVVTVNLAPDLPHINIDGLFLTAIFQNLLSNSVKYTPQGGKVDATIGLQRRHLDIHIADTGIGIPSAQQSQIFNQLFRADNAKQVDSNGTGLGLYIVKTMVRQLGGEVWFESLENQGTNFYVKLPVSTGTK